MEEEWWVLDQLEVEEYLISSVLNKLLQLEKQVSDELM